MKRIIILAAVLFTAVSCSYKQKVTGHPISFKIEPSVVKSNYIVADVTPEDDRAFYLVECIEKEFVDEFLSRKPEEVLMQMVIDTVVRHYHVWKSNYYRYENEKYVATFEDFELYYAFNSLTFTHLDPETDYCLLAFGVNPDKQIPVGELYRIPVRTTAIVPEKSNMEFDFMVKASDGNMSCYVKPTAGGKISKDPYICDYISRQELDDVFEGNLAAAIEAYKPIYDEYLDFYMMFDICRNFPHYFDNMNPGSEYIIFAFPYIPNCEEYIQTLTFTYEPNLYIPYTNDSKKGKQ